MFSFWVRACYRKDHRRGAGEAVPDTPLSMLAEEAIMPSEQKEPLPLPEAVTHLLEECRMVLPGLQALLGFQFIAIFNAGFDEKLTPTEQRLHLLALGFVALAGALVMAPASYHRQTGPQEVSVRFLTLASRLLLGAMILLVLGIGIDFYVIARVILANRWLSMLLTLVLVSLFVYVWFLLPRLGR
jgi:Family of unknown function (DUF6328)